jgi:hypothetical protein
MFAVPIFRGLVHFGSVVSLAVGALFPIVDPLGGAPIYSAMTAGLTSVERTRMAKQSAGGISAATLNRARARGGYPAGRSGRLFLLSLRR